MSSLNTVIIQLAMRPLMVVTVSGTDFSATEVADFGEFFEVMKKLAITNDTIVLINRGPGSYSGIRTAVSFAYGLVHGGRLPQACVHSFTSFDLVRAATKHIGPIYLKAWPRLPSGKLAESKGYFASEHNDTGRYVSFSDVENEKGLLSVGEEEIVSSQEYRALEQLLKDPVGYRELSQKTIELPVTLDPLYINPVHIT